MKLSNETKETAAAGSHAPVDLSGLSQSDLEVLATSLGEEKYRGRQLLRWIHGRGASSFEEMVDLPGRFRRQLLRIAVVGKLTPTCVRTASDGTVKMLLVLPSSRMVESVLIPDFESGGNVRRLTACVSSQVGCAMACSFCATGLMGFSENLTAGAIVDQVRMLSNFALKRYGRRVTNVVYMGMGEPLLNYHSVVLSLELLTRPDTLGLASRRITVSTVGLARRIRQLAIDNARVNLAVSLHAPFQDKRDAIMPAVRSHATSLPTLRDALIAYAAAARKRITFEYCLFRDFNDTPDDARELARLCRCLPSKVNLIQYNKVEGLPYRRTTDERLNAFIQVLVRRGVTVTVRRSRGMDIDAACGQLALRSAKSQAPVSTPAPG